MLNSQPIINTEMGSSNLVLSSSILLPPRLSLPIIIKRRTPSVYNSKVVVFACKREPCDWDFSGRLVDESMIVLRKRIHEMRVIERNYEPPQDWTSWEKQYYATYDELICKLVGFLQARLINTRPSLTLGILMLISVSVPASMALFLSHFIDLASTASSTLHLGA